MMHFPEIDQITSHIDNDYEKSFIEEELRDGFEYYVDRINLLDFSGQRVLDAGCGIGQWSCALSMNFKHVDAVDLNENRLQTMRNIISNMGLNNISLQKASIASLPFAPETFDAVFCYGVIMFTDMQRVLAEFARVMKPKAKLYVCLNADGWNKYLSFERGKKNAKLREVGQNVLYATYLSRAWKNGLSQIPISVDEEIIDTKLYHDLETCTKDNLEPHYSTYLKEDLKCLLSGMVPLRLKDLTRSYMPDEVKAMVTDAGYEKFLFAPEGHLCLRKLKRELSSKYAPFYMGELAVWEFVCNKSSNVD